MRSSIFFVLCLSLQLLSPQLFAEKKYRDKRFETAMDSALDEYGQQAAAMHGMHLLIVGDVTDYYPIYCLAFTSEKLFTLETGKAFFVPLMQDFLSFLNSSPTVLAYTEHANTHSYFELRFDPTPESTAMKIAIWDKEVNRPQTPYLAEMLFVNGNFHYYMADPETQELKLILKESYDEAIQNS